ncbi:iron chaperone [Paenibacillus qinlingensis]|uniref:iron chaperone n=1 Tax=Paenibacillus qinlingensis TaxID=1837343 RepID=UPI001564D644|nr:DUF1801 domain-containing protein [Paenibacillus qinlingensis]NQX61336.1 DUF1801 domain-containing protein [Paenibacillus qinlingensis]
MKETKTAFESIDAYIATFPSELQEKLQTIRSVIKESAPEATEKISYQMPTFDLHGNLVHFAAFKHHIGFYPTPNGIDEFEAELAQYPRSKGAVQFPHDRPLPLALISRIVQYRVARNSEKAQMKSPKKK